MWVVECVLPFRVVGDGSQWSAVKRPVRELAPCEDVGKSIEIHRQLLADSLVGLVDEFDVKEHRHIPKVPQDEGVPEHNVNLGAGNSQPGDVMTGSQCDVTLSFDLSISQSTTTAPEPGPSDVLIQRGDDRLCDWSREDEEMVGNRRSQYQATTDQHL